MNALADLGPAESGPLPPKRRRGGLVKKKRRTLTMPLRLKTEKTVMVATGGTFDTFPLASSAYWIQRATDIGRTRTQ